MKNINKKYYLRLVTEVFSISAEASAIAPLSPILLLYTLLTINEDKWSENEVNNIISIIYYNPSQVTEVLSISAEARAVAPSSPILLVPKLYNN